MDVQQYPHLDALTDKVRGLMLAALHAFERWHTGEGGGKWGAVPYSQVSYLLVNKQFCRCAGESGCDALPEE